MDDLHQDRSRAESFGSVAEAYDRYRPAPPESLIDDLVALGAHRVLDVGCGTGKAAVAMAARGLAVQGVEPDARMAELARGHGVPVEVATFEAWPDEGRRYDLVTFSDSWHWTDPAVAVPKVARLLTAGGAFARFWHDAALDGPVADAVDAVYARHAPEIVDRWRRPDDPARTHGVDLAAGGGFGAAETRTYRWVWELPVDDWVALAATTSAHLRLGDRIPALQADLRAALRRLGDTVRAEHESYLVLAYRG